MKLQQQSPWHRQHPCEWRHCTLNSPDSFKTSPFFATFFFLFSSNRIRFILYPDHFLKSDWCATPVTKLLIFEPHHDKTNKITVRPAKTQISLGIRPVLSVFAVRSIDSLRTQAFFMRTAKTLIRLCGCPGWFESSLGAHVTLLFCHEAAHFGTGHDFSSGS